MPDLHQLLYVSRAAAAPCDDARMREIVRVSARNNEAAAISGRLVRTCDAYVQLCEDPALALTGLAGRLARDTRHADMRLRHFVPIKNRLFGAWSFSVGEAAPDMALFEAGYDALCSWDTERLLLALVRSRPQDALSIACQLHDERDQILI